MRLHSPTPLELVRSVERSVGVRFPDDYVDFMVEANGAEGPIGDWLAYLDLWPIEEVESRHKAHATAEYWPGLVMFGSDGGGEAYGFMADPVEGTRIVNVPFVGSEEDAVDRGHTLLDLLQSLAAEGSRSDSGDVGHDPA